MIKLKRKSKNNKPTIRERIAESSGVSKEIILDIPKIVFFGCREATVENYKSISDYTETEIVLETNPRQLRFSGKGLEIKSISRDMIFVTGEIDAVEFEKEG